jgi:hypothetical protein
MKKANKTAQKHHNKSLFYNEIGSSGPCGYLSVGETAALAFSVAFLNEVIW